MEAANDVESPRLRDELRARLARAIKERAKNLRQQRLAEWARDGILLDRFYSASFTIDLEITTVRWGLAQLDGAEVTR